LVASSTGKEFPAVPHQSSSLLFLHNQKLCLYSKQVSILYLKVGTQNGDIHKYYGDPPCLISACY